MTRRPSIVSVLRKARSHIAKDVESMLDCACLHDAEGRPIRESIDDMTRPFVERAERLIDEIDAVLKEQSHG